MGPTLTGIIFCLAAVMAAYILRPKYAASASLPRATFFWFVAAPILFLSPSALLALVICGVIVVLLNPQSADEKAVFYMMTLVAVPSSLSAPIPFPGLNYLIDLNFAKVACLALLLPTLVLQKREPAARVATTPLILILLLTILYSVQEFRDANLTSAMRAVTYDFLLYFIPVAAVTRLLSKRAYFDKVIGAFGYIGIIFVFAALISEVFRWNFYTYAVVRFGNTAFADFRDGVLRVAVTLNSILCGYMFTLGLLATEYFRAENKLSAIGAWLQRGAFAVAIYFTYSRGAWLSMMAAVATYYFFTKAPRSIRMPVAFLGLALMIPVGAYYIFNANFGSIDKFGTFEYRQELFRASIIQIKQHPLFGDPYFLQSGNFDHLVQGQGIVDIVNHYLQIALEHGLVALVLYVGAFGWAAFGLFSLRKQIKQTDDKTLERQRAVFLAAIASFLLMIMTTSAVSLTTQIGMLILAVSTAFVGASRAECVENAAAPALPTSPPPAREAGPAVVLPKHLAIRRRIPSED
ncbi:MAG: hypothetical protein GC153_07640 [Alphaproteobacteria bacterium]|nr:hypothetical protein [Alphaproteobacteria bacterium]